MAKDVIYLEVDDEITSVIDKLQDSPQSVVALVLPKRATVFQSIVNMKLLQKTAAKAKKSVVLITSDATVMSIAGAAKMHVAKTLQSKPTVPVAPEKVEDETTAELDSTEKPTPKSSEKALAAADDEGEAIELDNTGDSAEVVTKTKPNKKLKIPNFNSFRIRFFLIVAVVFLLIFGWVFGAVVLPKATITIKTDTSTVESSLSFTANTATKEVDKENKILPATAVEVSKSDTEKVTATGEKNNGEKASGKVVFYNCSQADKLSDTNRTVPAGTTISSGGYSFVTSADVTVQPSSFIATTCQYNKPSGEVAVVAAEAGSKYNLSARTYSVAGYSSMTARDNTGMGGGTDSVIKVVTAADVETAKARMAGRQKAIATEELKTQLASLSLYALVETVDEGAPALTADPAVGKEAQETTVTAVTKFTMLGISQSTLEEMLAEVIKTQITNEQQQIQDNGLAAATLKVTEKKSPTEQKLDLKTLATIGPNIDKAKIAADAAGKKRSEIETQIMALPGVKEVTVNYSPFWVLQTPKAAKRINVVLEQAGQ